MSGVGVVGRKAGLNFLKTVVALPCGMDLWRAAVMRSDVRECEGFEFCNAGVSLFISKTNSINVYIF